MATTHDEFEEIVHRVSDEAFNQGNFDVIDEYFAEDVVMHNPMLPEGLDGRDGYKQFIRSVRSAFPDIERETEDLIVEGNKVVDRHVARGTHEGEFMGVEPTGKEIETEAINILRFEDGQVVERWEQADTLGMMAQLGVVELPGE